MRQVKVSLLSRKNPLSAVEGKTGVSPVEEAAGDTGADELLLQEGLFDQPAKILRHPVEVLEGDMREPAASSKPPSMTMECPCG